MANIHIPPEAVEAAQQALITRKGTEAAIRAALAAWPGMHIHKWQRPWLGGMIGTDIILPLTEPRDDQ